MGWRISLTTREGWGTGSRVSSGGVRETVPDKQLGEQGGVDGKHEPVHDEKIIQIF